MSPEEKMAGAKGSQIAVANTVQMHASMNKLIIWNISKALEKNPCMDLKSGLRAAQERLERDSRLGNAVMSQYPDEQHLVCALLAWQQLGHTDADSLYQFIETKKNEELISSKPNVRNSKFHPNTFFVATNLIRKQCNSNLTLSEDVDTLNFGSYSKGPVVRLPVEPKIIMRADRSSSRERKKSQLNTSKKVTAACCMDSECAKNLAAMDADTEELRKRAAQLAKREAERVELLERAESAWGDLELGYQRRLRHAEEKEEDMTAQISKIIQERNDHKENCLELAQRLKEIGEAAECEREKLIQMDKNVCERACLRLRLSEEAAKGETILAEEQCKAVQLERDLQFKEEQARRKLLTMDNETESARVLIHEAERALRAELGGLRDQITEVSNLLLEVDDLNKKIKAELEELRIEKAEIIEDLDGCKLMCDTKMQSQVDELQKKRQQLEALKQKVLECKCKLPVDAAVEVKRTASLAALCKCTSDDRFTDACSCTSLRSRLISSLLADLFGGLQSELGGVGLQMPCQLLKCLEDKHNWDRSSVIKTNLRNFFSQLLVGELDIAITTSIENYHAKWTGASCADELTMKPSPDEDLSEGWEKRALERRAQKLAEKLAEQLFQDRADELTERAKEIVKSGPPPCECNKAQHNKDKKDQAKVLQCFVEPCSPFTHTSSERQPTETPANWNRTHQDVTQLRLQIEDLKKEFIKKEDLKLMEENITKIVKQAAVPEIETAVIKDNQYNMPSKINKKDKSIKNANIDEPLRPNLHKTGTTKKRSPPREDANSNSKKYSINEKPTKQPKKYNYNQAYAVNLCMCGPQKPNKILQTAQLNTDAKSSLKQKPSKEIIPRVGSVKQTKPIEINFTRPDTDEIISKVPIESSCGSNCKCFQKMPSNTSIEILLKTLTKWKCDLGDPHGKLLNKERNSLNTNSFLEKKSNTNLKNKLMNNSKVGFSSTNHNEQDNDIVLLTETPMHFDEIGKRYEVQNFNLATNTTSEYMGAINLDKSIENVSTCVDTTESNNVRQRQENNKNISNECPIQSINLSETPLTIEDVQSQSKDYTKVKVLNEHLYGKIKNTTDLNVLTNSKSTKTVIPEGEHELKTKEILNQTDLLSNEFKETQLFPNNFDYYIKFLGVTLADADSHKVTKNYAKDDHKKSKTYSPSSYKDMFLENQTERHKIEVPKLISDLKAKSISHHLKQFVDDNASDSLIKTEKCACNTKLEEFQRFMINIFSDQSKKKNTQQKDKALDSPSLKCTGNHLENCACCNSFNIDNSKDLEANAFYLLEDHLKEKLREFKTCSCKSSCISPEQEEKIFSAILNRVKQVISDCANEAKCNKSGMTTDASWKRAYGLLQEYLKIKIKRAQYSPSLNENKDVVVPNILEKVCNLIEHDFQRLKDLCKCKKNDAAVTKKALIEHLLLPHEDFPEKDTDISVNNDNITCKMLSKQNLVKPIVFFENISSQVSPDFGTEVKSLDAMAQANCTVTTISRQNSTDSILITQTISSQVPPNLGLETKSCDALEIDSKSEQTSETTVTALNKKSQGIVYNTCNCNNRQEKTVGEEPPILKKESLRNKYIPIYLTTDIPNMTKTITPYQKQYQTLKCSTVTELGVAKSLPDFEIIEYDKKIYYPNKRAATHTDSSVKQPYLGCTIDCTCNGNFEKCICSKSVIQHCTHKIGDNWKQFIVSNNNCDQDLSYIMNASYKKRNVDIIERMTNDSSSDLPTFIKKINCENACETEANDKEVVLLLSRQSISTSHQNTNTSPEITMLATDIDSEDSNSLAWVKSPQTLNTTQTKTSNVKFTNIQYDYEPIDESTKSCKSETTTDTETTKISQNCDCYHVPICHVKMLVEDIERNILQSKCTCDSVSKICPVHSKKYL